MASDEAALIAACRQLAVNCQEFRPPLRLHRILNQIGIAQFEANESAEAALRVMRGRLELCTDSSVGDRRRQRFSVAHELAHVVVIILSSAAQVSPQPEDKYEYVEYLCDLGAAELLMPASLFIQALNSSTFTVAGLDRLCSAFDVSQTAVLRRFVDVMPDSSVAIVRHSDKTLAKWKCDRYHGVRSSVGEILDKKLRIWAKNGWPLSARGSFVIHEEVDNFGRICFRGFVNDQSARPTQLSLFGLEPSEEQREATQTFTILATREDATAYSCVWSRLFPG